MIPLAFVAVAVIVLALAVQRHTGELRDLRARVAELERRVSTLAERTGVNTAEHPADPHDPGWRL